MRFWIYSQAGVSPAKIASLTVIAGVTYWLGMVFILAIGLIFRARMISELDHLEPHINMLIGIAALGGLIAYLAWVSIEHRWTRIQGFKLELPGFKLTTAQIVLSVIDLCAAAGVLYALLPDTHGIDFFTFAAVYVFACALGIASYAPGGIGVFEATMLKILPIPSQEGVLASLLMFRIIYYLIPFVLAFALLGANEGLPTLVRPARGHASRDIRQGCRVSRLTANKPGRRATARPHRQNANTSSPPRRRNGGWRRNGPGRCARAAPSA